MGRPKIDRASSSLWQAANPRLPAQGVRYLHAAAAGASAVADQAELFRWIGGGGGARGVLACTGLRFLRIFRYHGRQRAWI
ncbi:hypothetical protein RHSIM_Rhsim01G0269400 [Rhododendron simsii]|uniref:Uncharacterized protein n=1 Tax=Rhododendron simsii TaxID=118357 RepID=A0A834HFC0_RHOSS|nr:hypothetical protein RHSIM_Rhsim01G0269400 [Rhododendron simsii]